MESPKTLSITECHQLLSALVHRNAPHKTFQKGIRNYLIACLMLEAGLRVGEVVALEMSDLYFNGKPVESVVIRPAISKSKTERTIPVSIRLADALTEYHKEHEFLACQRGMCCVFSIWPSRKPMTTRQVERIIRSAAMKALGRPVHPHMLRHTFGTRLMRKTNARVVQELLGHKYMSTTQIYCHPNQDDLKRAIDKVDEPVTRPLLADFQRNLPGSPPDRVNAGATDQDH